PASGPRLLDLALALAPGDAPRIYALHVSRPAERGALGANLPEAADGALDPLLARARDRGVAAQPLHVTSRTPADAIVDAAAVHDAQLIVMGWHQPVFRQSVLGGTLDRVLRRSPADVAVLIDKGLPETLQRILLPYAGTRHDRLALRLATQLARRAGADLTLLHVVRRDGAGRRLPGAARQLLDTEAPEPLTGHQTRVLVIESDRPVDAVLAEAARCDLTVLGVGEEWEIGQQLFGLRSERVAVDNPASLLIVRAAETAQRRLTGGTIRFQQEFGASKEEASAGDGEG
ncbi:MAG: universal stress protein, partial [Candidatus Binatia bacterium]